MTQRILRTLLTAAAFWLLGGLDQDGTRAARAADLFYNHYVPNYHGGPPAQLYLSPRPTPPLVGHTYITYQPLMPHEFLYRHYRVYYRWGPYLPVNRTAVLWW